MKHLDNVLANAPKGLHLRCLASDLVAAVRLKASLTERRTLTRKTILAELAARGYPSGVDGHGSRWVVGLAVGEPEPLPAWTVTPSGKLTLAAN
jgi:hypothetical protein